MREREFLARLLKLKSAKCSSNDILGKVLRSLIRIKDRKIFMLIKILQSVYWLSAKNVNVFKKRTQLFDFVRFIKQ